MAAAIFTNAGQAHATDRLTGNAASTGYYIGWGSGATAPAVTQTALVTENAEARTAATVTRTTTESANDTVRFVGTITATGNRSVQEAAVFTAAAAGTMVLRGTHALLNIETGDRVEYTFDLQLADVSGV